MSLNIVTCIIKRHGKLVYNKKILSSSFRQYANLSSKLQEKKKKAKILAAAPAPAIIERVSNNLKPECKDAIPKVIGQNNASRVEDISETDPKVSIKSQELDNIEKKLDGFHSYTDFVNLVLHKEKITEKTVPPISNLETSTKTSKTDLTLVNALKPTYVEWHKQILQPRLLLKHYMALSKIRLTGLVVLTTAAGYGMAYASFDPWTFGCVLLGTGLMSASANTMNQFLEIPYDSQMARTKNRVLVRGLLTPCHAVTFALCTSVLGCSLLYFGVNGMTATLGIANLLLYAGVYTPLKRCSILNTWVGSIVGAIPPLMGWAACSGTLDASALILGAILYSWQFPHFNALSWNLRPDYSRAGYRMMSVVNSELCRKTALRHSYAILIFCTVAPVFDLTTWSFPIDSLPFNLYFIYNAHKFYNNADSQSSRKLFRLSLLHLPALMILMFVGRREISSRNSVDIKKL